MQELLRYAFSMQQTGFHEKRFFLGLFLQYLLPQLQALFLQRFPLTVKFLEFPVRLLHLIGVIGNTLIDQLPEPLPRRLQINADAEQNGMTIVPAAREINGIQIDRLITPLGSVGLYRGEYLPTGTAFLLNLGAIAPVFQPVPGKGNFFLEELAKAGAGEKYQLFGQIGLDHGMEWFHGKFTNLSTEFEAPKWSKSVYISGGVVATTETDAILEGVTLNKSEVDADDTAQVAVSGYEYNVKPATDATRAYLWQVRAKNGTTWTDLTSSYTGYNTATLTVKAADAEKHYRCKVTASGSAQGTVYSPECDVKAAAEG